MYATTPAAEDAVHAMAEGVLNPGPLCGAATGPTTNSYSKVTCSVCLDPTNASSPKEQPRPRTYSAKINRWVAQAEALGLVVEVEEDFGDVLQTVTVRIRRPHVDPVTMLDVVKNADQVSVHACRTFNTGKWSHSASRLSYSGYRKMKNLAVVRYVIERLAE